MRRVAPAIALFFLSPLVAEFLLGDFTLAVFGYLLFLGPMYGGGAVLIRETVRRTGRGWPSMVLLALAYGVFEEGVTTQSLFNPDYAHVHLLDSGFVPALGIAIPWTLYVLALHTVWSMSVPIALVEEWTERRTVPWLHTPGLVVAAVLFVLGAVVTTFSSYSNGHFMASWPQLATVAVVVAALIVAAFALPRRAGERPSRSRRQNRARAVDRAGADAGRRRAGDAELPPGRGAGGARDGGGLRRGHGPRCWSGRAGPDGTDGTGSLPPAAPCSPTRGTASWCTRSAVPARSSHRSAR